MRPCPANTYGVAGKTFGLINAPCKSCTKNLFSAAGSNKFDDCKNPGGFGYTTEGANQCPDGFWAAKDSMKPCEPCPEGRTTHYVPGNGTFQDSQQDCIVPPGHGIFSAGEPDPWAPTARSASLSAKPCPVGYQSTGDVVGQVTTNPTCTPCPSGTSTAAAGSETCDVCATGFGMANGTSTCTLCGFGSFNPGSAPACSSCASTTFNDAVGDSYTSYGVTFAQGLGSRDSCVPRYAQLPNPAGDSMALPDSMYAHSVDVSAAVSGAGGSLQKGVQACVEACPASSCCIAEMLRSGSSLTCKQARLQPVEAFSFGDAKLFYKLPPSEMAAASLAAGADDKLAAKTIASGIYAACNINSWANEARAGLVGTSTNPELVEAGRDSIEWNTPQCNSIESCKKSCAANAACWGFIFVEQPGGTPGFALRGGEMTLGGRAFFVSPDAAQADATVVSVVESWSYLSS